MQPRDAALQRSRCGGHIGSLLRGQATPRAWATSSVIGCRVWVRGFGHRSGWASVVHASWVGASGCAHRPQAMQVIKGMGWGQG